MLVAEAAHHTQTALSRTIPDSIAPNKEQHSTDSAVVGEADISAIEHASYACAWRLMSMLAAFAGMYNDVRRQRVLRLGMATQDRE